MQRKDFILQTWPFLLVSFAYFLAGLTLNKFHGEVALHQLLNQYNGPIADFFFTYFTRTGEWIFGIIVVFYIVYKKTWRYLWIFVSASVLQFLMVQTLKRWFFIDHLRPAYLFEQEGIPIYLVEGIHQGITFSFPSGHTATAFFLFCLLSLITKSNWIKLVWGIAAVLSAYSRIYLSQHFMQDTIAGGLIGIFCVVLSYYFWYGLNQPKLNQQVWTKKK